MSLSNSFSFSVTATDIIREAMLNIGAIGESETPTASEFIDCQRKLNMLIKQWMGIQDFSPGLKMWTRARGDLFLHSTRGVYTLGPTGATDDWAGGVTALPGQNFGADTLASATTGGGNTLNVQTPGNYTIGDFLVVELDSGDTFSTSVANIAGSVVTSQNNLPSQASGGNLLWNYTVKGQRPLAILTASLRYSTGEDIALNVMTLQDYEFLPTKTMPTYIADPTAWYYESQIGSQGVSPVINGPGVFYTDVGGAQDTTRHIHCVYLRPTMDIVNPGDNPEYPQQWYRPLCWGLSREICGMFDAEWTQDMNANLSESLAMARQADPETTSLYFQVDADLP